MYSFPRELEDAAFYLQKKFPDVNFIYYNLIDYFDVEDINYSETTYLFETPDGYYMYEEWINFSESGNATGPDIFEVEETDLYTWHELTTEKDPIRELF